MTDPREALARVISDHQLTGRISIGCAGCPGLEFMTSVEHAEHVADMIGMQFLVVPQSDVVGLEYGWRYAEEGQPPTTWKVPEGEDLAVREVRHIRRVQREQGKAQNAELLSRPVLSWSVVPLPEDGDR
ncbi:hypothetical protein [Nocardia asiatica]|uniref:hypothetical protein n=1 Tax=Nocardia asiatica TaxID=209252 RepID=UPI0003120A8C|nr:hypothetical protein [Nocardia asiatica]